MEFWAYSKCDDSLRAKPNKIQEKSSERQTNCTPTTHHSECENVALIVGALNDFLALLPALNASPPPPPQILDTAVESS